MKRVIRQTVNRMGRARRATLHGREHIVVPMTMIVPGVLIGSRGPLFYPEEEIARNASDWNGMPILLGHPKGSGRNPDVINRFGVGHVFNACIENRRLTGEAWFDVERLKSLAPESLRTIESGGRLELSTGFASGFDSTPGTHNGQQYTSSVVGIRPDHLAVFVNGERGACSVRDGCGINSIANGLQGNRVTPLGLPQMVIEPLVAREAHHQQPQRTRPVAVARQKTEPLGLPSMEITPVKVERLGRR